MELHFRERPVRVGPAGSLEEEMAMTRIPRLRRLFALAAVLALTVVPLASARPLESPAVQETDGGFVSATLRWVENLVGLRHPGPARHNRRSGPAVPQKAGGGESTQGGSCIDPHGHPVPCPR